MQQIKNATTGSDYTAAATLEGVWNSPGGYYSITGGSAYMELQYAPPGQGVGGLTWTNEVLVPVGNGNLTAGTTGVRFRDAGSVGGPAVVTAALSAEAEPLIIVGAPGSLTLATGGTLYGVIDGTGDAILSGSGFALTKNGVGDYTIVFTTAFAALPAVAIGIDTLGTSSQRLALITAKAAGSFRVVFTDLGGVDRDGQWSFIAGQS